MKISAFVAVLFLATPFFAQADESPFKAFEGKYDVTSCKCESIAYGNNVSAICDVKSVEVRSFEVSGQFGWMVDEVTAAGTAVRPLNELAAVPMDSKTHVQTVVSSNGAKTTFSKRDEHQLSTESYELIKNSSPASVTYVSENREDFFTTRVSLQATCTLELQKR